MSSHSGHNGNGSRQVKINEVDFDFMHAKRKISDISPSEGREEKHVLSFAELQKYAKYHMFLRSDGGDENHTEEKTKP